MGAWIETIPILGISPIVSSHPVWVRGLKHTSESRSVKRSRSHPVWVRGLKHKLDDRKFLGKMSHPVWVRGLKLELIALQFQTSRRTPCGCVD